eukprot:TRINITY_DN4263_c0_g1_i2.p1 TRINITY_DN4263_c0_g1~~TRINITY_DN4263_c0_g1_i2.p1  ORF type:complete len:1105 (+),score=316.09 TRINITY_DN4263_c0_g1_i2:279-3593(+)
MEDQLRFRSSSTPSAVSESTFNLPSNSLSEIAALEQPAIVVEPQRSLKTSASFVDNVARKKVPWAPAERTKAFSFHGRDIFDDYDWLKDKNNPKVLKYLEEENRYADACMSNTRDLQTTLYDEFVARSIGDDRSCFMQIDDFYYYTRTEAESQYPIHCRRFESLDNEELIILDENQEAEGEDFFTLGPFEISMDHNYLTYGVDTEGYERFTLRFKNLIDGTWLDDEISGASWTVRWAADNKTIFYTMCDDVGRSYRLFRHVIGENAPDGSDDKLIYQEDDPRFVLQINTTNNKKYFLLLIEGQITKEVRFLSTSTPMGEFKPLLGRTRGHIYGVGNHGNYFYIRTNENALNFKVVKAPVDDPADREYWEEILPHRDDVFVERIDCFRHHYIAWEWENGIQKIRITDLSDGEVHYVQLNEPLYAVWPGETEMTEDTLDVQYFNSNLLHFTYTSFLHPNIVYEYDMDNRRKRKKKETIVPGFVKDHYHQKRIFATSHDGKMIPISLVYKISMKNAVTGNPLLLAGYGAYGTLKHASFSAERLSLLDRGIIFAFAHVRGDATMGWSWYEEGKFTSKKNTFLDFISCAEHLISEGYTTPDKLAIWGRSAGGLLVTAVANMRPDLFKVVATDVPFVDVSSLFDVKVPWTTFEWEEWGDPNNKEIFDYMLSYSPYGNIEAKSYPHMFITAGLNDSRVAYWEPAKYTAKLRKLKTDTNLVLLKTYLAGHMGASGRFNHFQEMALQYAFVIMSLDVSSPVSSTKPLMTLLSPIAVTPPDLLAMFQGYQVTMLLCAALDLGVFNQLHQQDGFKGDCHNLAKALKVSERGLARLLDSLMAIGLLDRDGEEVVLTQLAASHLVKGMPGYVGDLRFALASPFHWKALGNLAEAVKVGYAIETDAAMPPVEATLSTKNHTSSVLIAAIDSWVKRRKSLQVLDLRCGNGTLGFAVARKYANVRLWSMDSPEALEVAKNRAVEMNVAHKVTFVPMEADLSKATLEGPFDLIIVGDNTLNSHGYQTASNIIQQISDALTSTGRVALVETVSDLDQNPYPNLQSISMFVTQRKGKVHNLTWYRDLLTTTGFAPPVVHDLRPFPEKLLITFRNIISKHSSRA